MITVPGIYASTSGNTQATCEFVADVWRDFGINLQLSRAEQTPIDTIIKNHTFVIATSTWEHGRLNPYWDKLLHEMEGLDLHNKHAAFIGLGDRRYEPVLFCAGIEQLEEVFTRQGGDRVGQTIKIDGNPFPQLEDYVRPWALDVVDLMRNLPKFKT